MAAVKKEIEKRMQSLCSVCGQKDYEAIARMFTEDCTFLPSGCHAVIGREAIKECAKKDCIISKNTLTEGFDHFNMVNDNTIFTQSYVVEVDKDATHLNGFKTAVLWKKLDGGWYIDRFLYNFRSKSDQTQKEESVKKEIESRLHTYFGHLNKGEFDAAVTLCTEDAIMVPQLADPMIGKDAIRKIHKEVVMKKFHKMVMEKVYHSELLDDNTFYANVHVNAFNNSNEITHRFRDAQIWKKIDGDWYFHHLTFSDRED